MNVPVEVSLLLVGSTIQLESSNPSGTCRITQLCMTGSSPLFLQRSCDTEYSLRPKNWRASNEPPRDDRSPERGGRGAGTQGDSHETLHRWGSGHGLGPRFARRHVRSEE